MKFIASDFLYTNFVIYTANGYANSTANNTNCKHTQVWEWQKKPLLIINRHLCLCVAESKQSIFLTTLLFY